MNGWGWMAAVLAASGWWLATMPIGAWWPLLGGGSGGEAGSVLATWKSGATLRRLVLLLVGLALVALLGMASGIVRGQRMVAGMIGAVAVLAGAWLWQRRRRDLMALATAARVQEVCALASAELSAGLTTARALESCARSWQAMEAVSHAAQMGASVPEALRQLARLPGAHDLVLMAAAWQVAHRTGAGLADALASVAETVRGRAASARLVRSELSSARATARLMAVLPVLTLLMGSGMGGDPIGTLLGTNFGLICLAGGVVLMAIGLAWIEGIAGGIQRQTEIGQFGDPR